VYRFSVPNIFTTQLYGRIDSTFFFVPPAA
jgi:hypothetical protein